MENTIERLITVDFLVININALVKEFKAELNDYAEPERILEYANKYKELMNEYEKLPEEDKNLCDFG